MSRCVATNFIDFQRFLNSVGQSTRHGCDMKLKSVPAESRNPGLPDAEFDDLFTKAIAQATGLDVEIPAGEGPPPAAKRSAASFPEWIPENIREVAGLFLWRAMQIPDVHEDIGDREDSESNGMESSALAMVYRLIQDPRMKGVWAQLLQKSRSTGGFRLAANLATTFGPDRADKIHHASMEVVFRNAVTFGVECLQFDEQKRTHYLGQAQQLRSDARFLERMLTERRLTRRSSKDVHRKAKQLDDTANTYQMLGEGRLFHKHLLAKRFAVNMAATMRGLFGADVMYGTVATITRVVLDDDETTSSAVRGWCALEAASPGHGDNAELTEQQTAWRHVLEIDRLMLAAKSAAVALRNTRTDINPRTTVSAAILANSPR
jgi:hypothetical protein